MQGGAIGATGALALTAMSAAEAAPAPSMAPTVTAAERINFDVFMVFPNRHRAIVKSELEFYRSAKCPSPAFRRFPIESRGVLQKNREARSLASETGQAEKAPANQSPKRRRASC